MAAEIEDVTTIDVVKDALTIETIEEADVLMILETEAIEEEGDLMTISQEEDAQRIQALTFRVLTDQDALEENKIL